MKQLLLILLIAFSGTAISQTTSIQNKLPVLEGQLFEGKGTLSDVTVKVFHKEKLLYTTKTDSTGKYRLKFNIDSVYIVELTKPGYTTKKYEVCTKDLTLVRLNNPINQIIAQTDMHKTVEGVDYGFYKKPMVKFFYNKKTDKFEYDTKHFSGSYEAQKKIAENEKKAMAKSKKKQ